MQVKPRDPEFQSRRDVQQLTHLSKNLYDSFPKYELEASRLFKLSQFSALVDEMQLFNDELAKWKLNKHEIRNIVVTYHLYENLFSRLKYISNFCKSQEESAIALDKVTHWFAEEKPKVRCQVKQKTANMKTYQSDLKQQFRVDRMLQSNIVKRELEAYGLMSRTAHPGFFPPKQQLKEYKRKQFLPFSSTSRTQKEENKKSQSASMLSKNRLSKFRVSMGTLATSATSFKVQPKNVKNTVSQFKLENVQQNTGFEKQNEQFIGQNEAENIQNADREDLVQKDQIMQGNLVADLGQEDAADESEQNVYEDQDIKKEQKIYSKDFDPEQIQYAKELVKENNQSTLRRVLKVNEDKIKSKLEDLDLHRNMANWGKVKGANNKQEMRKLEGIMHCNRYKDIQFKKKSLTNEGLPGEQKVMSLTNGFQKNIPSKKQPVIVQMLVRSKSSYPGSIEADIEKIKIKQVYKTYGRYLNHLPDGISPQQAQDDCDKGSRTNMSSSEAVRSMSLTCLASFVPKKNHFSNILLNNKAQNYNEEVQDEVIRIKTSLARKGSSIEKGSIYRALSSVPTQQIDSSVGFYTSGRDLPSNPFFPKTTNKKKKKN